MDWSVVLTDGKASGLESVYKCPYAPCQRLFIALFTLEDRTPAGLPKGIGFQVWAFIYKGTLPVLPAGAQFPQHVQQISPVFCEIYAQAELAEAHGLLQICGLGYRKAVEYLVKDFCISEHEDKAVLIKAMPLAQCIGEFVADGRVKACAERAVWIGNDEAHYIRKWVDHDVEDMRTLIRLTSNWIDNVMLTKDYQARMSR